MIVIVSRKLSQINYFDMSKLTNKQIKEVFEMPFLDLLYEAHSIHRKNFKKNEIELCTLLSIKTGACPEDCGYCSQSSKYNTGIKIEKLMNIDEVKKHCEVAKSNVSKRLCIGAGWKTPPEKHFSKALEMVKVIKSFGLQACATLGTVNKDQAKQLKEVGLDYYNHNLDTSEEYYKKIITTRTYQDRLDTLDNIQDADINVCCGGIIGMGESREDRINLLVELSKLKNPPKSIPINLLVPIKGTPLENVTKLDGIEFIRMIATTRVIFYKSVIRLSAGRDGMSEEMQALCFFAGANSIFYGEKLLTTNNSSANRDLDFLNKLGLNA
jgi:biotin synthase